MSGTSFTKIADHYRDQIYNGDLAPGARIPSQREMVDHWGVAPATVQRALGQLSAENLIRSTPRGTFVADNPLWTSTPRDRLSRVRSLRTTLVEGETVRVTSANLVTPPSYVGDIFDLDSGDQVVRREFIAGRGQTRVLFGVNWYRAEFAAQVPELLSTASSKHAGVLPRVLEATSRSVTYARDDMHARPADEREAGALGIPVHTGILAGAHRWGDDEGVIEYGEWCLPPKLTIGYEYQP